MNTQANTEEQVMEIVKKVIADKFGDIMDRIVDRAVDKVAMHVENGINLKKRQREEEEETSVVHEEDENEWPLLSSFYDIASKYPAERIESCAVKVAEGLTGYHTEYISNKIERINDKLRMLCRVDDEKAIVETATTLVRLRAMEKASRGTFFAPFAEAHALFERMKEDFEKESKEYAKANKINHLIDDYDIVKDAMFIKSDVERFIKTYVND